MTVYASLYTPSRSGGNGFQYTPEAEHEFAIGKGVDVAITHGPPHGIMDMVKGEKRRARCLDLFGAVSRSRPRLHCFGHIHKGWGAKLVAWREQVTERPSHFTGIDNGRPVVIDKLADISEANSHRGEQYIQQGYRATSRCSGDNAPLEQGCHTLFVNAAV